MNQIAEKTFGQGETPARQVRLFRNGANQAVRIPKEFELPGKEALMRREGNRLIIEVLEVKPPRGSAAALMAALQDLAKLGPIDEEFPDVDAGLLPLDDIDLGED
ncbi:antitoxin [Polaromonas sp.]|jgi:antitoxin VapB|uniref:antitoxin n=1 Tax=Polaromonas sp. TaxID=1869339 RepID=UPI001A2B6BCC|nr:AbrB/MazE/SpoVT family DNA-binding domain-containing protein [Burkholderiales bacterium]